MHAERKHALLSPSKADIWGSCTASIPMAAIIDPPERRTKSGDAGTAAHELLEAAWKKRLRPTDKSWSKKIFNKVFPVTPEMQSNTEIAYDLAEQLQLEGFTIYSEVKVKISVTGEGGTVDIAAIKRMKDGQYQIKVIDYKNGRGVVKAKRNRQIRLYAIGVIEKYIPDGNFDLVDEIELIIVQPNVSKTPDRWFDDVNDLFFFGADMRSAGKKIHKELEELGNLKKLKREVQAGKMPTFKYCVFAPSEKACGWCPVRFDCKHSGKAAAEQAKLDFEHITTKHMPSKKAHIEAEALRVCQKMTPKEMNQLAHNIDFIEQWVKTLRVNLLMRAAKGELEDFKVVQNEGNRSWTDQLKVMEALKKLGFKEKAITKTTLIGIVELSKQFPDKKKFEAFLRKYTKRGEGTQKMVSKDDPRPSTNPADDFVDV